MHTKVGTITGAKMTGTVTVTVHRSVFHPLYRKRFRVSKKFLADSRGVDDLGLGDTVLITECRPLSKRKHFKITEVIKRAPRVSDLVEEGDVTAIVEKSKTNEKNKRNETDPDSSSSSHSSHPSASSPISRP